MEWPSEVHGSLHTTAMLCATQDVTLAGIRLHSTAERLQLRNAGISCTNDIKEPAYLQRAQNGRHITFKKGCASLYAKWRQTKPLPYSKFERD